MAVSLCGSSVEPDHGSSQRGYPRPSQIPAARSTHLLSLQPQSPQACVNRHGSRKEQQGSQQGQRRASGHATRWPSPNRSIIEFKQVEKRYRGRAVVADLSLAVAAGSFFALLSPNDAGKTTSIRMMSTLTRPSSGTITVAGHDVVEDAAGVRHQFGVVFQNQSLDDDLTVDENLQLHAMIHSMPVADARRRAGALLEFAGMASRACQLACGLSGGEKRRI